MSDILDKLNSVLGAVDLKTDKKYFSKDIVLEIISLIKEDQNDILLNIFEDSVKKSWNVSNIDLREKFYEILEYYGIIGESENRKFILEHVGKNMVKKFINVKEKEKILEILKKNK
jgi:hypothetical protein